MAGHKWEPSRLGHSESVCAYCHGTNREIAVIGDMNECLKAPPSPNSVRPEGGSRTRSRSQPGYGGESAASVGVQPPAPHTPGPWVVWSSIYEGMVAQVRSTDLHERPIAEVRKHPSGYRDALLMAAAPDLLEALKELHEKTVVGTDAERHAALDQAWAAIMKATGQ